MGKRLLEIDALRGLAIVMMVIFHFVFDLNYLGLVKFEPYGGMWLIFQRTTAVLFLLVAGAALSLKFNSGTTDFISYLDRAAKLGAVALLITIVTWIYPHDGFIVFGIIHLFALATLFLYLAMRAKINLLFSGLVAIIAGLWLGQSTFSTPYLFWLGVVPENFYTLDYFPLLPWFGIILIGAYLGKKLSSGELIIPKFKNQLSYRLSLLGQKSLLIYLAHQPVLFSILMLYKYYLTQ